MAGEPAGEDVDRLHLRPVDACDVAVVRDVRVVVSEQTGRGVLVLGEPGRAEPVRLQSESEPVDPGEQMAGPQRVHVGILGAVIGWVVSRRVVR